jgi:hypothetical protein
LACALIFLALPQLVLCSVEAILLFFQSFISALHLSLCTCATLFLLNFISSCSLRFQSGSFLLDQNAVPIELRPFLLESVLIDTSALVALFLLRANGPLLRGPRLFLRSPGPLLLAPCSFLSLLLLLGPDGSPVMTGKRLSR